MVTQWEEVYRNTSIEDIPWQNPYPDRNIIQLLKSGRLNKGKVLDMCCGTAVNSVYLASKGFDSVGVDISSTAVEIAKYKCMKRRLKCNYFVGNVLELGYENEFELVFDRGCYHHIEKGKKKDYASIVAKALKKGAFFYLQCFSEKNGFKKDVTKTEIEEVFSSLFKIEYVKEAVHKEPNGPKIYMHSVLMSKI